MTPTAPGLRVTPARVAALGVLAILAVALTAYGYVQAVTTFRDSESYAQRMLDCDARAQKAVTLPADPQQRMVLLNTISDYCFNDILNADHLGESNIRRGMFIHQRYENNVILFMVVAITLAGVALAGLQLLTSYNLAATGHGAGDGPTELSLEQGRLSIKSSVTGLIVLGVSLAFFVIYVAQVYAIKPTESGDRTQAAAPTPESAATTSLPPMEAGGGNGPAAPAS